MFEIDVVISDRPISLPTDLDGWLATIKTKVAGRILQNLNSNTDMFDHYIDCVEIQELPGTFMCCSFYQQDINEALTRAGIFMGAGKGVKEGTLPTHSEFSLINYKKLVAGHNLPGPVVKRFYEAISASNDPMAKASLVEQVFFHHFANAPRVAALGEKFYLIGFSIQTTKDQRGVISHEIFHAYYFLNPAYRDVVRRFWREVVSPEDKVAITQEIGKAYNVENEDLVIDEFQAYLVQNRAEHDRMKIFVPKYRAALLEKLNGAHIDLLQI